MFKFEVPENDQSVYEITTESGNHYLIRCPGERSFESDDKVRDGMLAFLVVNGNERAVMLRHLSCIANVTRRPDLPVGKTRPLHMGSLMWRRPGEGVVGFLSFDLA